MILESNVKSPWIQTLPQPCGHQQVTFPLWACFLICRMGNMTGPASWGYHKDEGYRKEVLRAVACTQKALHGFCCYHRKGQPSTFSRTARLSSVTLVLREVRVLSWAQVPPGGPPASPSPWNWHVNIPIDGSGGEVTPPSHVPLADAHL